MAQWVMGIDGGGTGCRAVLADGEGRVAGQADGGPANVMSDREGAVASILAVSLAALGGRDPAHCVACLGLAGAEVTDANGWLPGRLPFARAVVVQDARIALQGALGDVDGIVAAIVVLPMPETSAREPSAAFARNVSSSSAAIAREAPRNALTRYVPARRRSSRKAMRSSASRGVGAPVMWSLYEHRPDLPRASALPEDTDLPRG